MRRAFQIVAVLERARLALVPVHGQITRARIGAHKAPFRADGKPAPPSRAIRFLDFGLHIFPVAVSAQVFEGRVAAFCQYAA